MRCMRRCAVFAAIGTLVLTAACDSGSQDTRFDFSGAVVVTSSIQIDGDINDPDALLTTNNTLGTAQTLLRPTPSASVVVSGYVGNAATEVEGDRFENTPDPSDFYRVPVSFGNVVVLEFEEDVDPFTSQADLDLWVYNDSFQVVDLSLSENNTTEMVVLDPGADEVIVEVRAYEGAANYTLTVAPQLSVPAIYAQINVDAMIANTLSVEAPPRTDAGRKFVSLYGRDAQARVNPVGTRLSGIHARTAVTQVRQDTGTPGGIGVAQGSSVSGDKLSLIDLVKTLNAHEGADVFKIMHRPTTLQVASSDPTPDEDVQWNLYDIAWDDVDAEARFDVLAPPLIAVLDAGFVTEHPDLASTIVDERDFISFGFPADAENDARPGQRFDAGGQFCHTFHGTHVASTAVGPRNNQGMVGVYPDARLMAVKLGSNTQNCRAISSNWPEAVLYAAGVDNVSGFAPTEAADVVNMSFGGPFSSAAGQNALSQAAAEGVILVASAGNSGGSAFGQFPSYPAAYDDVIAVGATNINGSRAFYSSTYQQLDMAAPGGDTTGDSNGDDQPDGVYAAVATPNANLSGFDDAYAFYQGTSMASPHVAAGFALMKAIAPNLTAEDVEGFLTTGALTVDAGAPGHDNAFGHGLMSLSKMAQAAETFNVSGAPAPVTRLGLSPSPLDFGTDLSVIAVSADRLGDGALSVEGFTADGDFAGGSASPLRVEAKETDAEGRGLYRLFLDRSQLLEGTASGTFSFLLGNGETTSVTVTAQAAQAPSLATVPLYLALEEQTGPGVFEARESFSFPAGLNTAGGVGFEFLDVDAGTYRLLVSTDLDHDGELCDAGEVCGRYPPSTSGEATFTGSGRDAALRDLTVTLEYEATPLEAVAPQ